MKKTKGKSKRKTYGDKEIFSESSTGESTGEFHSTQEYFSENDDNDEYHSSDNEDDDVDLVDHASDEY